MSILDRLREPLNEAQAEAKREAEQSAHVEAPQPPSPTAPPTPPTTSPAPVPSQPPPSSAPQPTPPGPSSSAQPPAPPPPSPSEIVFAAGLKALGALAGLFTLTGFVTLVGGAVYWTRFETVGIPYDQAVSVVEPTQLLVVGASVIVVFALTATLALLFLFALDTSGYVSKGTAGGLFLIFLIAVAYAFLYVEELDTPARIALIILAGALAVACLTIAVNHSKKFVPFAAAVFVSVLVWGGLLGFLNARALDQVQAAAVFGGKDVRAARGFYVADSDETIYLARFVPDRVVGSREGFDDQGLFEIDRRDEGTGTRLAIGPLQDRDVAIKEAKILLRKLRAQSAKEGKRVAKDKKAADDATTSD